MAKKPTKCAQCKETITIYYSDRPDMCKKCADNQSSKLKNR